MCSKMWWCWYWSFETWKYRPQPPPPPQCKCLQIIPLSLWTNRRVQWQPDKREQMPPAPDFNPIHSIDPRLQHHLRLSSFNFKQMQTTWSYENLSPLNIIKWTFGSPQVMCFHVLLLNRELDVWAKIWKVNVPKVHEKWNAYERQENVGETTI